MSKELVISSDRHETRVAIVEDDQVVEVYHQRENEYSLAGSIHKGRVTRVLPGMQSAFVDIGLDRDAFLYVSDFFEDNEEYDKIVTSVEEKVLKLDRPVNPASVSAAPVETEAPLEVAAAPASRPVETTEAAAAPIPSSGPASHGEQRRDDRDRDRRGRRGRRRRGQKGPGRGLPESKYYSPRPQESQPAEAPAPVAERASADDDFIVLPGESLAKYEGGPGGAQTAVETEEEPNEPQSFSEPESELEPSFEPEPPAFDDETVAESAHGEGMAERPEPAEEPQPELAAAVETAREDAADASAEREEVPGAVEAVPQAEAETAEDIDVLPTDAAEPEPVAPIAAESEEPREEGNGFESAETSEVALAEAAADQLESAGETEEPVVEPEGPEPARIPTSLTATLREQGPRYLHRVSRRMRRRGREGREPRDGRDQRGGAPTSEAARAPQAQEAQRSAPRAAEPRPERTSPSISDLLKEGQEIIVQIAKEPLGQKGARITSHIALPGRFLVYMPTVDHIGVSRKIPSDDERLRLKRVLQSNRTGIPGGYIVRTAGEGRTEEELRADMMFLYNLWLDMRQKAERKPAPMLIHHDLNVVERVLRDQLTSSFKSIWVDNEEAYESVLRFVERFQPALVSRVKLYTRTTPIFDEFGITAELEKALRPKVWLKSGGYIVINQTEALVAIDINTGKFVGKSNRLEDTIVKTNTDAIREIVRQIRLRDLGGIIVIDFIDMDERKNRQKVMQALEENMRADRAPYKILQFNDFGLVAITRKRVKQSLERTLCTPCPYCEAAGYVKSPQTIVGEILQEARKIAKAVEGKDVMLRVNPEVAKLLKSNRNTYLQELEEILNRTVIVKSDSQLHQEKFDLA